MIGITAFGAYIPRLRLQKKAVAQTNAWLAPNLMGKAKGERSLGNWDEDCITFAVEAARDALGTDDDRSHIKGLYFATTTQPFADRLNAGIVQAALTLEPNVYATDITGTQKAGLTALTQALAVASASAGATPDGGHLLVVAGDRRVPKAVSSQELDIGDGGAAIIVGDQNVLAEWVGGAVTNTDFIDHFRGSGEDFDYHWEERWIRDEGFQKLVPPVLKRALASAGVEASGVDHFILPSTFKGVADGIAKRLGMKSDAVVDNLAGSVGETGCAHALLMLAHTLEIAKPGAVILVAQFGQGCEALVFKVTDAITSFKPQKGVSGWLANRKEETSYMKYLVFNRLVQWDKGMRAEKENKTALTTLYRYNDAILGLVGGKCSVTGTVQYPRSRMSVAPNSPEVDTQEPYKFAERGGKILTYSADFLTYSMNPPNHYGQIDFEGGGRIFMDIADVEQGEIDSGTAVRMAFRVKEWDERRGFTRYFWKAVPVR
jgi:3-hydroxy-3-methylglutaryl CoA synthase